MSLEATIRNNIKTILLLITVLIGVFYNDKLQSVYSQCSFMRSKVGTKSKGIFSKHDLSQYNGIYSKKLYLSLMGSVFDVTKGKMHYGEGGPYNYFVGKDGSRSFITGNFKNENEDKDHVIDLSCDGLFGLLHWKDTFKQKYKSVGVLIGRYYDDFGEPTHYTKQLEQRIEQCRFEQEKAKQQEQRYPPCNIEWSVSEGTKVWCTENSGGVSRSWVGVPRQMYQPGEEKPHCFCINIHKDNSAALLKEYDNCKPESTTCIVKN